MPRKKRTPAPANIETPKVDTPVEPTVETPSTNVDHVATVPEVREEEPAPEPDPLPESPVCSRVRQSIKKQLAAQWNDQGGKL